MNKTISSIDETYISQIQSYILQYASSISINQRHLIGFNELYNSFAISKAEQSAMTLQEAQHIQHEQLSTFGQKIHSEVNKLDPSDKGFQKKLQKLHDKLEYANILATYRWIQTPACDTMRQEQSFTTIIQQLHKQLTQDLDHLFENILDSYQPYHSGLLRSTDTIFIGQYRPLGQTELGDYLIQIKHHIDQIKHISDIFIIHGMLYYAHPFDNGNKRLCRIIETILLTKIGVDTRIIPLSLGYYAQQQRYIKQIANNIIQKKDFPSFISFGYGSLILGALYVLVRKLNALKNEWLSTYQGEGIIIQFFDEGEKMKTKDLLIKYIKKTRLSEQSFYKQLQKEKELYKEFFRSETKGKNTYYRIEIANDTYQTIRQKIYELLLMYKQENPSYQEIDFLRHYKTDT